MQPNSGWQTNQQHPSENEPENHHTGEWSGIRPEQRAYNQNNGSPPFPDGFGGGWQVLTPVQAAKYQLKKAIKRLLPAMLIFLVAEYGSLYAITYLIDLVLSQRIMLAMSGAIQFPQGTYYGMRYGLYQPADQLSAGGDWRTDRHPLSVWYYPLSHSKSCSAVRVFPSTVRVPTLLLLKQDRLPDGFSSQHWQGLDSP